MKHFRILILIPLIFLLSSWGWQGHQIISSSILDCFNEEMAVFEDWVPYLTEHASDADYRKNDDPSEGPKHYIDIDSYPEFLETGRIPTTLDSCINIHGAGFVDDNGYLPWATLNTYHCLVECMKHAEWDNARSAAADLGHYVADGFMPLHITKNYDGQLTDNNGIHSRYEADMIGDYADEIIYEGTPVEEIGDVTAYVFSYLYKNYEYVDDIIQADDDAKDVSGGSYNDAYLEKLWEETGDFTIEMFRGASHALASLIYTAWLQAGQPDIDNGALYVSTEEEYLPDHVGVTFTEVGMIYVVPVDTEKDLAVIRSVSLDSMSTLAYFEVRIPLAGLGPGEYWLYARDYSGRLSGPAEFSVDDLGVQSLFSGEMLVYPNPIDQFAYFEFDLLQKERIILRVTDASGRAVEILQNEVLPAGSHKVIWNAAAVPPGTYFMLLEVQDEILVRKLLKE